MIPHNITQTDYYSHENSLKYMGSSQFKNFEKCEAAAGGRVRPDRLAGDALLLQLPDGGSHVSHPEGQVPQAPGLRIAGPGRRGGDDEQLDLTVPHPQVDLPVAPVRAIALREHRQPQLFHVKRFGRLIVRGDDGSVVDAQFHGPFLSPPHAATPQVTAALFPSADAPAPPPVR